MHRFTRITSATRGRNPAVALAACALLAGTTVSISREAAAGAWIRPAGESWSRVGVEWFAAEDADQDLDVFTLGAYTEVGVGHGLQLTGEVPIKFAANRFEGSDLVFRHESLGDVRLGLEWGVPVGPVRLAVGVDGTYPGYRSVEDYAEADGVSDALLEAYREQFPEIGDGVATLNPRVMMGASAARGWVWIAPELGYRLRLGDVVDSITAALGLGAHAIPERLAFGVYSALDVSLGSATGTSEPRSSLSVSGYALIDTGAHAAAPTVQVGGGYTPWGQNVAHGTSVFGALAWELR